MNTDNVRGYWRLSRGGYSLLLPKRASVAALGLIAALAMACAMSLATGSANIGPATAFMALLGAGDPMNVFLVRELRLERLLAGLFTGTALGIAGCLLQTLARNRLATPGVIGIDDGATAFAVASIVALPTSLAPSALALIGAFTAAALAFGLGGSGARGYRFIVVGIGVGAVFGALTNLMLARTDLDSANQAYPWTVGSLNARPWLAVQILGMALLVAVPAAKALDRALAILRFNDNVARGLGVQIDRVRTLTLVLTVLLTGLAVAVVGPVGLIALAAPEMARYLAGHRGVPIIGAGLAGALLMVIADWAGRTWFAPLEIPVGIVTALVGGPYLLWILIRQPVRRTP
jgi:iron complex transport system permease protein